MLPKNYSVKLDNKKEKIKTLLRKLYKKSAVIFESKLSNKK